MDIAARLFVGILVYMLAGTAVATTSWSTRDYDLYPGDFNGDGYTDLLYISKNPAVPSGIVLSDGTGLNVPLQSWGNAYLGIPWTSGQYNVIVADFDGDGKSDILLQRKTPGDSYLLLTEVDGVGAITQTIPYNGNGILWTADQHKIIAGDFNGDGHADLFFQSNDPTGLNAILVSDSGGYFTASGPLQSWNDGYAGLNWALTESNVFAGDFNGDHRADLLVQAQPVSGGTVAQPAVYAPNSFGVLLSQTGATPFSVAGVQAWSENGLAAHWSPLSQVVVVGDFNGDGRADVLLQAQTSNNTSYILYGRPSGSIFTQAKAISSSVSPTADAYRLLAGRFATNGGQLYMQALTSAGANALASISGSSVTAVGAELPQSTSPSTMAPLLAGAAPVAAAVVTPTSAGRTAGQFSVSAMGAATYQIPIWTPPGARGIEPKLALVYSSGAPDGMMGPGWNLAGLSSITRCNKTYADNAGAPAPVMLTTADDFCLDGNRLRATAGTYGAPGSVYQTEIANFSRITAYGTAGNGPSYFIVEGKDGLLYEYGNTADSKAYANGGSTPYAWMINKIKDRQSSPDNLIVTYSTTSGSIQPATIQYTQTPSTNGTTYPYTVSFTYQNRVTNLSKYVAGGNILQTQVLAKINVQSAGTSVRQYNLSYTTSPTTVRDRLATIQECGGSAGTDCLRPTTVSYQAGTQGVSSPTTAVVSSTSGRVNSVDINGDGRKDLVYATTAGSTFHWYVQFASSSGFGSPVDTGLVTNTYDPVLLDDFLGEGQNDILAPQSGVWYVARWNGSTFTRTSTGIAVDSNRQANNLNDFATVDVNGDGLPDLVSLLADGYLYIRLNTSTGGAVSFQSTAMQAYNTPGVMLALYGGKQIFGNNAFPSSGVRRMDFDGDGRDDLVMYASWTQNTFPPTWLQGYTVLLSRTNTFTQGAGPFYGSFLPLSFNDDACTDMVAGGLVVISGCNGASASWFSMSGAIAAIDWDGDGRQDILAASGGTLQVYRSLGTTVSTAIATGISAGSGSYLALDVNGDGLDDLGFVNSASSNAVTYGLHNGAGIPSDLMSSISDGFGVTATPTYVPLTLGSYTKYSGASFPEMEIAAPIYVVSSAVQTDGVGGTYTNSLTYFGARANRQGRGFEGFAKTRSVDSRNSLVSEVLYNQIFPFTGTVSERDTYQPNGTSKISTTVNQFAVTTLAGTGCTPATQDATSRCFPFLQQATTTSYEISSGSPQVQTTVSAFTFDGYGNSLTATTSATDNDPLSPNYSDVWQSVVTNTYGAVNTTTWCLDKPTHTTTQNSISGQSPAQPTQTRTVDHAVDTTFCRNTSETVEPGGALQAVTSYGFDSCGNANSVSIVGKDETGATLPARTTTSSYGTRCTFPESVTNALNQTATTAYNYSFGLKSSATDPNTVSVSWLYDNFGRKTRENRPDSTYTTWIYEDCISTSCWGVSDNLRLRITETRFDSAGSYVTSALHHLDGFDRLRYDASYRVLGTLTWAKTTYDSLGRKVDTYLPYSAASNGYHHIAYDLLNRPTSDQLYNSSGAIDRTVLMGYAGLKTTITDARLNSTSKWVDVAGKLRQILDPAPGATTNYTFDPFGNLVFTSDATSKTSSYAYNIRGFRTSSADPDTGTWTYTPDSLNELKQQTDAKGQVIYFGYDALGRMTSRLEPESATPTTWIYGTSAVAREIGHLKSVSKPDGYAESYTFDSIGRPATATITEDTNYVIGYAYNTIGAVDTVTYPASTGSPFVLKYLYSYGAVQQVKDNAAGSVFWSLSSTNDSALPVSEVLGNGVAVTSGYTPWTNDLISRQEGTGGISNSLQDLAYQWDPNGNLLQRQDNKQSLTEVFVHDALNRLSSSTLNGLTNLTVSYDAAGNITSKSDVGAYDYSTAQAGCSYQSYVQPHAVRNAGGAIYCYDANGNVVSRGGGSIAWTSYNLPSSIAYGSNSTSFNYNANRQRWKQDANYAGTHEVTYYVGGVLEKVTTGSGPTEYRHRVPAGSGSAIVTRRSDLTSSVYYTTSDHLGSGDLILSSTGAVLAKESFTPFGARRGSNWQGIPTVPDYATFAGTTRRGFTGHEMLDSVSLIHMNGRVYDPATGRFLSPDPILQTIAVSQALNSFSYVMNNPLALIDPSGYSWLSKLFSGIGHFLSKYWRAIVAVIAAVVSFGVLLPYCVAFAGSAIAGGMMAGAIAGAIAGGITGGWKGALLGAFSGAMFGGIAGAYGDAWTMGRVAANGVAGGISSEVSGGRFSDGFALSAILSLTEYAYNKLMKYDVTWKKGEGLASEHGNYVEAGGVPETPNVFGTNVPLSDDGSGNFWKQGGWLSRHMDAIPGMHSLSRLHDYFQIWLGDFGTWARELGNVPAMIPATAINYAALFSTVPGYPAIVENR